ncbi:MULTISPECIES: oligoribonuclease [unclassified Microbacterium]|uniref:oligoribonuclease n=1 Tax=unclassified Microbacterium TaxID=2609290 RepID=UPI0028834282|nr:MULTISPECIES: oligoribonuclease [unclassified Microbacterium]
MEKIPTGIDLEMTGLDPKVDCILEFAQVLLTRDLEPIDDFGSRVLHASEEQLAVMSDYVREMHTQTGLLDEVRASTLTVEALEDEVIEFLAGHGHVQHDDPRDRTVITLGASLRADMAFIDEYMPRLAKVVHYRIVDVSGFRETLEMILPGFKAPQPFQVAAEDGYAVHRAASDIRWSIAELREIRDVLRPLWDQSLHNEGAAA